MHHVSQSLAGRVGICELLGLSQSEIQKSNQKCVPFIPTESFVSSLFSKTKKGDDLLEVYKIIWSGSYPKLFVDKKLSRDVFYSSYVQTYIQRDVRDLGKITDLLAFQRFLKVAAARTGQLINYADMARDVDVDQKRLNSGYQF